MQNEKCNLANKTISSKNIIKCVSQDTMAYYTERIYSGYYMSVVRVYPKRKIMRTRVRILRKFGNCKVKEACLWTCALEIIYFFLGFFI